MFHFNNLLNFRQNEGILAVCAKGSRVGRDVGMITLSKLATTFGVPRCSKTLLSQFPLFLLLSLC